VRVAVFAEPPFAMQDESGRWTGYAVTLLDAAAVDATLALDMQPCATLQEAIDRVGSGAADIGVGNTLVTSERLSSVDFSQPILDGGLRMMVPRDRSASLSRIVSGLWENGHVHVMIGGALVTLAVAAVLLAVLRRLDKEFTQHWHEGFAESLYHVVSVVMTGKTSYKGKIAPGWVGRIFAALWLVFGVASVAYLTSSLTSVMTSEAMASRVMSPRDLHGKRVGALKGSVGERYCAQHSLDAVLYATVEQAAAALSARQVDAVVADAQTLEYYDTSHPDVPVTTVGEIFERRHYAFPVHRGDDDLRQRVDRSIVSLRESGALDRLRERWFGK
jgi:ABC-type amino acid transport substrate-binding protein